SKVRVIYGVTAGSNPERPEPPIPSCLTPRLKIVRDHLADVAAGEFAAAAVVEIPVGAMSPTFTALSTPLLAALGNLQPERAGTHRTLLHHCSAVLWRLPLLKLYPDKLGFNSVS